MSVTFVAAGDIDTFDDVAFRYKLLERFPTALDVSLTVTASSVSIASQLVFPAKDDGTPSDAAAGVMRELETLSPTQLSSSLGVTIESVATPVVSTAEVFPGPPMPPALPPPSPDVNAILDGLFGGNGKGIDEWGEHEWAIVGIPGLIGLISILCLLCMVCCCIKTKWKRQAAARKAAEEEKKEEKRLEREERRKEKEMEREERRAEKALRRKERELALTVQESRQSSLEVEDDWEQFDDEESGHIYWHNYTTHETTWVNPI